MKKKFDGMLIISDIDGTIHGPDNIIPERNIAAVRYFCDNGGTFTIGTARDVRSARRYIDTFAVQIPAVLCNGALLYDFKSSTAVISETLPPQAFCYAKTIMEAFPEIGVKATAGDRLYYFNETKFTQWFQTLYQAEFTRAVITDPPEHCNKIVFISDAETQNRLVQFVEKSDFTGVNMVATEVFLYEMMAKDISKGSGLRHLAEYLHVPISQTYAIGDFYNDREMFRTAGMAVTVENAPDQVKSWCDLVVGPCENGAIADLIAYLDKNSKSV